MAINTTRYKAKKRCKEREASGLHFCRFLCRTKQTASTAARSRTVRFCFRDVIRAADFQIAKFWGAGGSQNHAD